MKKIGKRSIWISIVVASMLLTGCGNQTGSGDRATGSDAVESVPSTTEVAEEATTEATLEVVVDEGSKPEAVPATTEIGGGKKKAEETTEEKKPSTTESTKPSTNHSNGGSASSGQSTTPKPSNNGNSGNSGSGNSGNSSSNNGGNSNSTPSQKPSTPATTEAPAAQHQHNYNVWVKTKDAWDETVIDTPEQRIDYPEQGYYAPAMRCNTCCQVFTSSDDFKAHKIRNGGSCPADGYGSTQVWVKTKDPYTEVIPAKTHTVHHDEEGYWTCSCGARK